MEDTSKKSFVTIVAVIIVVLVGGSLLYNTQGDTGEGVALPEGVATPEPTLAPQLQLTQKERAGDVGDKKADIVRMVRSGKLLTPEQKSEIGGIMLTKAHIYNFSEEERQDIFAALQR